MVISADQTARIDISDADDQRLDDYRRMSDPAHRRAVERDGDYFIVEGVVAIRELLRSRHRIRSLLLTPNRCDQLGDALATVEAPVYLATRDVIRTVAGFDLHRGAVASANRPAPPDPFDLVRGARRLAILEGVNDHENLGSFFRNAAAFGIDAVLLDPTSADPYYRRSIRVSLGHVLHVPSARFTTFPDPLTQLRDDGWTVVALTPSPDAEPLGSLGADRPDRIAFLLGAEGPGLSPAALDAADRRVRIEMRRDVDSVNVATAAAIAFHALARTE